MALVSPDGGGARSTGNHSRDDPEIPFEHLERYSRVLPHAIVRALDGRGHELNQPEFPELADDIRRLAPQRH